ncbi:MAG: SPOR domain-containing protein [Sphingomonas sp.]|nr:SPOR domain-containing protein [Sphingomonas sp.]
MESANDGQDEADRLPWLETADDEFVDRPSISRIAPLIMAGLLAVALIVFGYIVVSKPSKPVGDGQLIAAQEGDYKVKPSEPGGREIEGEGDMAFATTEGKGAKDAKIDLKQMPETPVIGGGNGIGAGAGAAGASSGGSLVQIGSFPDAASANAAWARASKRFTYLAPLGHSVERADVNGRTVHRLRVNAGSATAASELCGKLQVAGEACFVPKL